MAERNYSTSRVGLAQALEDAAMRRSSKPNTPLASALNQYAPKPQETGGLSDGIMSALQSYADEATGAFARYGRRSGKQRDDSIALMNYASAPGTDPLTGAGMKALGLAGLVTHPLAFFPTREEWDERLTNAGNDSRMSRSIGGFLSDLPSLIDPQMAAGGAVLAAAPLVGKMAKPAAKAARVLPTDVTGYSRGESFGTKVLKVDDAPQAAADLSILGDTVYINNIETLEGSRRGGLASKLVDDIFAEFPDKKIAVTNMTDDGSRFFRKRFDIDEEGVLSPRAQAEAAQVGTSPSTVSRDQALQGLVGGGDEGFTVFHGTGKENADAISRDGFKIFGESGIPDQFELPGISTTPSRSTAQFYAGGENYLTEADRMDPFVMELRVAGSKALYPKLDRAEKEFESAGGKISDIPAFLQFLKGKGYKGVTQDGEVRVFDPADIQVVGGQPMRYGDNGLEQ